MTSNSSGVPESPTQISLGEELLEADKDMVDEDAEKSPPAHDSPETSHKLLWDDVTLRTKALSNPSSFQRPRTHY